jgi:hypothetical protein
LVGRSLAALAAAGMVAVCGMVAALGAYANIHPTNHKRLTVFSHPLQRRGHAAYAGAKNLPPSAVLAEVFGNTEIYVSEEGGLTCVIEIEATSGGSSCGKSGELRGEGSVNLSINESGRVRVGVLAPNGVSGVALFDHGGASRYVKVTNNVAEIYDPNVASVQFKTPDGSTHTTEIPYHVLHPAP